MKYVLLSGIGMMLFFLGIQDFKDRKISIVSLVILQILCATYFSYFNSLIDLPKRFLINAAFTSVILVSGTLLVRLRRPKEAMSSFIGAGDFLFLFAISPLFSLESFLVFLNTSIIMIIILFGVLLLFKKVSKTSRIPLAGIQAVYLFLLLVVNELISIDLLNLSLNNPTF